MVPLSGDNMIGTVYSLPVLYDMIICHPLSESQIINLIFLKKNDFFTELLHFGPQTIDTWRHFFSSLR